MDARDVIAEFAPLMVVETLAWADSILAALADAGFTLCGEQVGDQHQNECEEKR